MSRRKTESTRDSVMMAIVRIAAMVTTVACEFFAAGIVRGGLDFGFHGSAEPRAVVCAYFAVFFLFFVTALYSRQSQLIAYRLSLIAYRLSVFHSFRLSVFRQASYRHYLVSPPVCGYVGFTLAL